MIGAFFGQKRGEPSCIYSFPFAVIDCSSQPRSATVTVKIPFVIV